MCRTQAEKILETMVFGKLVSVSNLIVSISLTIVLHSVACQAASPPAPKSSELSAEYILLLIKDLESSTYSERMQATEELKNGGIDVVRILAKSIPSMGYESSVRSFGVIQKIYFRFLELSLDLQAEEAEVVLNEIGKNSSPRVRGWVSNLIEVLESDFAPEFVQKNAIRRLSSMGVEFIPFQRSENHQSLEEVPANSFGNSQKHFDIVISNKWQGDNESMRLLRRLKVLREIPQVSKVYLLPTTKISNEKLSVLRSHLPFGAIQHRSPAFLGVKGKINSSDSLEIHSVIKTSPAGQTGIKPGDQVSWLGSKRIRSTKELNDALCHYKPGQTENVILNRYCPIIEKRRNGKERKRFELRKVELNVTFGRK